MHKEAHQAAGGPTSLGATSKEGAHPQLSSDKTKAAGDGLKTAHTDSSANKESKADDISLKVKLKDLSNILKDTRSAFFSPDSPSDEPIIVSDESEEEEEVAKDKQATSHDVLEDTLVPPPTSLKSTQIQELIDEVAELKNIQWELPTKFLNLPTQVSLVQEKLKTLDSLPSLLHKVTAILNREDGSDEVISNLKTRLDQLTQTEQELKIDLNKPLKEQDPLNELNELANKKRKRTSDLKDHSRGRLLGSVPEPFSLSVLRRLGSIFTSVYAAVQKLKKDSWKELQFSLVYKEGKGLLCVKRNKATSLGNVTSRVGIEVNKLLEEFIDSSNKLTRTLKAEAS
ncbi:hypothetical protein Tco_0761284 [Tanacetum coccineum]